MVLDSIIQLAFQNPELIALGLVLLAVLLSWDRVPATVPFLPGLYVTGFLVLVASAFYFFAVPKPSTAVERGFRFVGDALFGGIILTYLIKKGIDIGTG